MAVIAYLHMTICCRPGQGAATRPSAVSPRAGMIWPEVSRPSCGRCTNLWLVGGLSPIRKVGARPPDVWCQPLVSWRACAQLPSHALLGVRRPYAWGTLRETPAKPSPSERNPHRADYDSGEPASNLKRYSRVPAFNASSPPGNVGNILRVVSVWMARGLLRS